MSYTRRDIGRFALTGLPARMALADALPSLPGSAPDSRWAGVEVSVSVPSSFGPEQLSAYEIASRCAALGISAIELGAAVIESELGVPVAPSSLRSVPDPGFDHGLNTLEEEVLQDEVESSRATFAAHLRQWRSSISLEPLTAVRHHYASAGVRIAIVKWNGLALLSDDEADYAFGAARALGADALATDLVIGGPRRLGPFADRHRMRLAFSGDAATDLTEMEAAFSHGRLVAASPDVDQSMADHHGPLVSFLEQHAGRVTHVRLRASTRDADRSGFGETAAATREILQAMRARQWPFLATVDLEDDQLEGAARMAALAAAVAYCRSCLFD